MLLANRFSAALRTKLAAHRFPLFADARDSMQAFLDHLIALAEQFLEEIGPEAKQEIKEAALEQYDRIDVYPQIRVDDDLKISFRPVVEQALDRALGLQSTAVINWQMIVAAVLAALAALGAALGLRVFQAVIGLAILVGLSSVAIADQHAVVFDDSQPGTYLVTVDAVGGVTAVPLKITRVGSIPNPPPPPTGDKFEQAIQQLTKQALDSGGSKTTGAGVSSVYSLVADGVADGSIAIADWQRLVKLGTDKVLAVQADGAKWTVFRTEVGKALSALANEGSLATKTQVSNALQRIANGMNRATGFDGNTSAIAATDPKTAGILDGIDIAKLIELIKLVMELIKVFGGG